MIHFEFIIFIYPYSIRTSRYIVWPIINVFQCICFDNILSENFNLITSIKNKKKIHGIKFLNILKLSFCCPYFLPFFSSKIFKLIENWPSTKFLISVTAKTKANIFNCLNNINFKIYFSIIIHNLLVKLKEQFKINSILNVVMNYYYTILYFCWSRKSHIVKIIYRTSFI